MSFVFIVDFFQRKSRTHIRGFESRVGENLDFSSTFVVNFKFLLISFFIDETIYIDFFVQVFSFVERSCHAKFNKKWTKENVISMVSLF